MSSQVHIGKQTTVTISSGLALVSIERLFEARVFSHMTGMTCDFLGM